MIRIHQNLSDVSVQLKDKPSNGYNFFVLLQCYEEGKHDKVYAIYSKVDCNGYVMICTKYGKRTSCSSKEIKGVPMFNVNDNPNVIANRTNDLKYLIYELANKKETKGYFQVNYNTREYCENIPIMVRLGVSEIEQWIGGCFQIGGEMFNKVIQKKKPEMPPQDPFDAEVANLILS